jgi:Predicted P-loop ATPase fused to an acetyltransferase
MTFSIEELIASKEVTLKQLSYDTELKPFDCGNDDLNEFLKKDAVKYLKVLSFTTFLLEADTHIVAYYSLANDLLRLEDNKEIRKWFEGVKNIVGHPSWTLLLNQKEFPAAKIGRLAVHKDWQRLGVGSFILNFLTESFLTRNKTGCQFLTVDALNNTNTTDFYQKNGFDFLVNNVGYTVPMGKSLVKYAYQEEIKATKEKNKPKSKKKK